MRGDPVEWVERIPAYLDAVATVSDMNLPGFRYHALKRDPAGFWTVMVSGTWRVTFLLTDCHAIQVQLIVYHSKHKR